jgi:hypothetical protein
MSVLAWSQHSHTLIYNYFQLYSCCQKYFVLSLKRVFYTFFPQLNEFEVYMTSKSVLFFTMIRNKVFLGISVFTWSSFVFRTTRIRLGILAANFMQLAVVIPFSQTSVMISLRCEIEDGCCCAIFHFIICHKFSMV